VDTYPYELLDGRRFQQLVQSLLVRQYPGIQCMPVVGPDGGRDAIEMRESEGAQDPKFTDAAIFQVKFREPQVLGTPETDDLFRWLTAAITRESTKIARLEERGAREYILITNIPATGHLDTGLRDRVQRFLDTEIDIPARCWWREDLDARLASQFDLVVHFGLFKGPEALRAVLEGILGRRDEGDLSSAVSRSSRDPAVTALLAFLDAQYREDDRLRFKQADLPATPLLDFFVDVPVDIPGRERRSALRHALSRIASLQAQERKTKTTESVDVAGPSQLEKQDDLAATTDSAPEESSDDEPFDSDFPFDDEYFIPSFSPGGADMLLLLAEKSTDAMGRVVVEGAPGQGKSTLGQYICQVHRIRLLQKDHDLKRLPGHHAKASVRLPFRVELRHLATYLRGRNPWERASNRSTISPPDWAASLESYLAAAIRNASGGLACTQDDIVAILAATPSVLVLDGLDEVADIDDRINLVAVVQESLNRLTALGADYQVVVTSRPAAFVKAPSFSQRDFVYLVLRDLPRRLIDEYAERWIRLRDMPNDQAEDFRTILSSSLDRSHVADLARNPMQLAILLWLIFVRGWSLPDRRTSLYESYMDTFLNREAEKSPVVRQHREVLLELHGHLGWVLHAQSEIRGRTGDIEESELRTLLKDYLLREERPPQLVDELFRGVERMFVLVSRIEGRFEFEVQPLREFFAGRHLYKTAPHSTSASPALGSRPDRLEALIRNPYWLNVARFFCGWYDKGELADLARRLEELCDDPEYTRLGHPRLLIARLLRDYVMTASRRDTRSLATAMLDDLGLRMLCTDRETRTRESAQQGPVLPSDAGLDTFVEVAQKRLAVVRSDEQLYEITGAMRNSDVGSRAVDWWLNNLPDPASRAEFDSWLHIGTLTDIIPRIDLERIAEIFSPLTCSESDWFRCVENDRADVAALDPQRLVAVTRAIAAGGRTRFVAEARPTGSWLQNLTSALWEGRYFSLRQGHRIPVRARARPQAILNRPGIPSATAGEVQELRLLTRQIAAILKGSERQQWLKDLQPYEKISYAITETLGECWAGWRVALIGATVPGRSGAASGGLIRSQEPILFRARQARFAASDRAFWLEQISGATRRNEQMVVAATVLAWADSELWPELFGAMMNWWNQLEQREVVELVSFVQRLARIPQPGRRRPRQIGPSQLSAFDEAVPATLVSFLLLRMKKSQYETLVGRLESAPTTEDHRPIVAANLLSHYTSTLKGKGDWTVSLPQVRNNYGAAQVRGTFVHDFIMPYELQRRVSPFATEILEHPTAYPLVLVRAADMNASTRVLRRLPALHKIAERDGWFSES
jgi:hypothetical protein